MLYTVIVQVQRRGRGVSRGSSQYEIADSLIKNFTDSKLVLQFSEVTVLLKFFINNEQGAHDIR
jgi:hypothetical protein